MSIVDTRPQAGSNLLVDVKR